jgi:DNA polymerase-3 subunit alpha (Gram-positive type)
MTEERIIWYDIETTGLNLFRDKIIEIAAIDNNKKKINFFINPEQKLNPYITKLTKITDDMIKNEKNIDERRNEILDYFDFSNDNQWIISHNNDEFDILMMINNLDIKKSEIKSNIFCNLKFSRKMQLTNSCKLNILSKYFGIEVEQNHRALDDVILLKKVFKKLIKKFKEKYNFDNVNMDYLFEFTYYN